MFSLYIVVFLIAVGALGHRYRGRRQHLPPSPRGHWLFAHTFEVPSYKPWRKFDEWGRTNGSLYSLSIAGTPIIVLNEFKAANDLLNKRLNLFSTRQPRVMASLCGFDKALTLLPPGPHFKKTRRYLQEALNARATQAYESMQEAEARTFALRLLESSSVHDESRMLYSSMLLSLSLGHRPQTLTDLVVTLSDRVAKSASLILTPGKFWVEFFPLSKYLPSVLLGARVNRSIRTFSRDLQQLVSESSRIMKLTLDNPEAPFSFCSKILRNATSEDYAETKTLVDFASISMYSGAVDTTIAALDTFFIAMMLYPHIQLRAQEEVDRILGRLPTHQDRPSLPFVEAVLTEILRWNPPTPMTSRRLHCDVTYGDFIFPRGCNVVANIWGMNHDKEEFANPDEFRPERFLEPTGDELIRKVHQATFGFGTRVCPGQHFATSSLWITIATLLATFTIRPVPGDEPVLDCEEGALIRVLPYSCDLKPRSTTAVDALKRSRIL
ncbi:cytochrome P450 [Favolaschia claudopus]|uniref:Cytochrome P450 n=1 Tax=Favolaschia claudopus TaxID=2862362 RepID=A0AAW0AJZ2_9AGAR